MSDQAGSAGFCGQCGAPLVPGAKFCGSCGATVAAPAKPFVFRGETPLEKLPLDPAHLYAEDTFDEAMASDDPVRLEELARRASAYQEIKHFDQTFGLERCDSFFVDGRGAVEQARDILAPSIKQNLDATKSPAAPFQVEAMEVPSDGRPCIRVISLGSGLSPVDMGTYFILFDSKPDGIMVYVINSHGNGYYAARHLIDGRRLGQDETEALCSCARASEAMRMFGANVYTAVLFAVGQLNNKLLKNRG